MKRYEPCVEYSDVSEPHASLSEHPEGRCILASEALAEIERLRGLLREAHVCTDECCQCIRLSGGNLYQRIEDALQPQRPVETSALTNP